MHKIELSADNYAADENTAGNSDDAKYEQKLLHFSPFTQNATLADKTPYSGISSWQLTGFFFAHETHRAYRPVSTNTARECAGAGQTYF